MLFPQSPPIFAVPSLGLRQDASPEIPDNMLHSHSRTVLGSRQVATCFLLVVLSIGGMSATGWAQPTVQEVVFRKRPTQVLDEIHQTIRCELDAERSIRQHNQLVDSSKQTLDRKQDRTLTVLAMENGRPTKGKLDYRVAVTNVRDGNRQTIEATQPIAEHVYFVHRIGDSLQITDDKGKAITEEENKILQEQLQNFGKPNPLAEFLNGQRIRVGQSVQVPEEVASQLLGMAGRSAKTDKLALTLVAVQQLQGQPVAVFETLLKTNGQEKSMSLVMKGELTVEANTCRTRSIRLLGPVAISETKGPAVGRFMVHTTGTLKVAITTDFASSATASRSRRQIR